MYLKLKDIFDEAEKKKDEENNGFQIGSILSYFCLNTVAILTIIYVVLCVLKIEEFISTQWNLMSVFLYVVMGIGFFYSIFILPAFLQNKLIVEILLILFYLISGLIFLILINLKLDDNFDFTYICVTSSLLITLGIHVIYAGFSVFKFKDQTYYRISFFICISMLFAGTFIIASKADRIIDSIENWVGPVLFIIAYVFLVSDKVSELIFGEKDDEKSEKNNHENYN
jgi:hypothetical protein